LAEATLFVTGRCEIRSNARRTIGNHVACGQPFGDTQLAIVDPKTSLQVSPGSIGEIWIAGESIADGYWKNPDATAATFNAQLAENNLKWLRTGDLGFISDGELFITGRLRELIIIAGKNHFPIDLERTVESADPAIAISAAFSVESSNLEKLIIVAELRRETHGFDPETTRRNIRTAIATEHEVSVHEVVLLRPGKLPRTTSGKISRRATCDAYLNQTLERFADSLHVHANT